MREIRTVMTRKGQITVPAEIRRALHLKAGDHIALSVANADPEQAILRRVPSVADLTFGALIPRKRPEDFKELRQLFEDEVAENMLAKTPRSDPPR